MKLSFLHILIIIMVISLYGLSSCSENYTRCQGFVWNTVYHITYRGKPSLEDSITSIFTKIERSLSVFNDSSVVSRLNRTDRMEVDDSFIAVYQLSKKINEKSHGLFDPTVSPLITAWGFGPGHTVSADTLKIDSIMNFIGIGKTRLEGNYIVKDDSRIQFNFSAIAKGYGCDAMAEMLRRNGVSDFMVEIGGEISLGGKSPSNDKWKISIDTPEEDRENEIHQSFTVISLTNAGIATSGNYRNYHIEGNNRFGHTISPVTGYPVANEILSATVIAPSCMEADAVATACMALGKNGAITLLEELGFDGLLILQDSVWQSPGFKKLTALTEIL